MSRGEWLRSERAKAEDFPCARRATRLDDALRRAVRLARYRRIGIDGDRRERSALARPPTQMGAERLTVQVRSRRLQCPRRLDSTL